MSDYPEPDRPVESVDPSELDRILDRGDPVRLLDVRNRDEVEEWHIEGADLTNVPFMKFLQAEVRDTVGDLAAEIPGEGPVVAVCGHGEASAYVAALLEEAGVEAYNLAGGMRGWARVYQSHEVDADAGGATVYQYRRPSSGCLGYLVVSGGEAVVVDPLRAFADRYPADAADLGADLVAAVDTHVHADHFSGLDRLADRGIEPVVSAGAAARGLTLEATTVTGGDRLSVGDVAVEAVAAPGHTSGMTAFAVGDVLLTGDALFTESVPRPDLEEGDAGAPEAARELYRTLTDRFDRFPEGTVVAPGHYGPGATPAADGTYTATLGDLRERLPVFGMDEEAFVEYLLADMPPRPANFEAIIAANLGRESVGDDEAFELELGPNNCAATPAEGD